MPRLFRMTILLLVFVSIVACATGPSRGPVSGNTPAVSPPSPSPSPASTPSPAATPGKLFVVPVLPPPAPPPGIDGPGVATVLPPGAELALSPGGRPSGRLRPGVVVPVSRLHRGWARILTPCELTRWIRIASLGKSGPVRVVLDPGHGGDEPGAAGKSGLTEKTVNLAIAARAAELLGESGIPALLTRTGDYRATLGFRVELAGAAGPAVLVSIHHNADPDGPLQKPGSETYYQIGSAESKRLAGLMYEEVIRALSPLAASWVGDTDAGAKWRPNARGGDYYGILRRAREKGIVAILAELAFISNPSEEALLARRETQDLEAAAVVAAVTRYLQTQDPGSGFTTPYPRTEPAGPGGGQRGCTDPS